MPLFKDLLASLEKIIDQHDNQTFMEGTMAACAIVAIADGKASSQEITELKNIVKTIERLKVYEPQEAMEFFNLYVSNLQGKDAKTEKSNLLKKIQKTFISKEDKVALLKICWAVVKSDGNVSRYDYASIEEIAKTLKIEYRELYKFF